MLDPPEDLDFTFQLGPVGRRDGRPFYDFEGHKPARVNVDGLVDCAELSGSDLAGAVASYIERGSWCMDPHLSRRSQSGLHFVSRFCKARGDFEDIRQTGQSALDPRDGGTLHSDIPHPSHRC